MSKPNLLGFSSSVGIYRNKRMRDLRSILHQTVHRKIEFAELAPMLFQVVMAYAGENEIDGNFADYDPEDWAEIFQSNHVQVSRAEASAIVKGFEEVGLFDHGKIRSWAKYNRHFAEHEQILKAKRKAGKIWQQKRAQEAREMLERGKRFSSETAPKPEKNSAGNDTASKELYILDQALHVAKGRARRQLERKRQALLSRATGVDLSEPPPSPPPPAPKARKQAPGEFQRALVSSARQLVASDSAELLTEGMVKALLEAGDKVPEVARHKFPKLLAGPGDKEARDNPVPG